MKICKTSLFCGILACVGVGNSDAAIKTNNSNRSYAGAYQQINAMRYNAEYAATQTATTTSAAGNLPVAVADAQLADDILNNNAQDGTSVSDLEACSMIYPTGLFRWEKPESGVRKTQKAQCVAVVELRDATTNAVLATTTLAAGDTMRCNIDYFPEYGMNAAALSRTELPADVAPTMADVEAVMNEEQKQNAGVKIAAGAIIAGLAGNILARKEPGAKTLDTIPLGMGREQLIDTAIGATAGAGIMAASAYSGKVAGDTIQSTAVNAASGMVMGNMLAGATGGDSVIATSKCTIPLGESITATRDCILGYCVTKGSNSDNIANGKSGDKHYFIAKHVCREILECEKDDSDNKYKKCVQVPVSDYMDIHVKVNGEDKICSSLDDSERSSITETFQTVENMPGVLMPSDRNGGEYVVISNATKVAERKPAYAVFENEFTLTNPMGYSIKDWNDPKNKDNLQSKSPFFYPRNSNGTVGKEQLAECDFIPSERDADDGALVDLSNQARAKGTIIGAATGGTMGGFTAYQGARSEITDRWTAALREYEDSLSNFMCSTGSRFLSKYNDYVEIPELKKSEQ